MGCQYLAPSGLAAPPLWLRPSASDAAFGARTARLAVRSLYAELALHPKPGLVSLVDSGSHSDMNAATFMRSLFSLRHYFRRICLAGMEGAPFATLRQLGVDAERRMMAATGGINTHRGAIFSLGLLCAAAGSAAALRIAPTPAVLRQQMLAHWGRDLAGHCMASDSAITHGLAVAVRHAASGAREEAALGLPSVFEVALPALHATLARAGDMRLARVDALFALMAHISDTNVYHRGGADGADTVRRAARRFIAGGGTAQAQWRAQALSCHALFIGQKLSPGGAADLLAATCLVHALTSAAPCAASC
ncbi:triphosphoribosyl-dephospho-CoA synthase MdcB [Oxalobacteraceae bacterium]|nr:triphosphoribosyl-dephospho-CoA synthase MdcB [Oxalobacteraceae bacterium]